MLNVICSNGRLPNLLVVGAMKAGTSTLCAELGRHPEIWFPQRKEPNALAEHLKGKPRALVEYGRLYSGRPERFLGDGSTGNTKVPYNPDTSSLAADILCAETKIIYVTREPLTRIERHIAHEFGNGKIDTTEDVLFSRPDFLAVSAYKMQMSYWRKHFSESAILEVSLENLVSDRTVTLREIFLFLGVDPTPITSLAALNMNRGAVRRSAHRSLLRHVLKSQSYAILRERLPQKVRQRLAAVLLPPAAEATVHLTPSEKALALRALTALNKLDAPSPREIFEVIDAVKKDARWS